MLKVQIPGLDPIYEFQGRYVDLRPNGDISWVGNLLCNTETPTGVCLANQR